MPIEITDKRYLQFRKEFIAGRKTPVVKVGNPKKDVYLGEIKWWGAWRKFVFFPESDLLFDAGCLKDIAEYIEENLK